MKRDAKKRVKRSLAGNTFFWLFVATVIYLSVTVMALRNRERFEIRLGLLIILGWIAWGVAFVKKG